MSSFFPRVFPLFLSSFANNNSDQSTSVIDSERASFWSTLRLGGNLRERCTLTDPERGTLDQMLSHLRDLWNQCARHKAEQ